uniref:Uncharacterized protein n=1 Tax=Zea mays TaxID=4577 RepID=A0A804MY62_MAIZE
MMSPSATAAPRTPERWPALPALWSTRLRRGESRRGGAANLRQKRLRFMNPEPNRSVQLASSPLLLRSAFHLPCVDLLNARTTASPRRRSSSSSPLPPRSPSRAVLLSSTSTRKQC